MANGNTKGHSTFLVCDEMQKAKASNKLADRSGQRESTTPALHLTFGGGDWQKITTKDTKSAKREFDDFFNRVIGCAIKFHRCNNTRAEGWHLVF